ncbi:MAG: hypothetical protein CL834_02665 [Crocinitomicaceae bacterium]|nr:hypothetical protein [Crocinitomicaceae bacterium]
MNENLNSWERLKKAFESFEPEVTGNWDAMKSKLDALTGEGSGLNDYFVRRARIAERLAMAATAVAIGMGFWVSQQHEEKIIGQEIVVIKVDSASDGQAVANAVTEMRNNAELREEPWSNLKVLVTNDVIEMPTTDVKGELIFPGQVAHTSTTFFVDAEAPDGNDMNTTSKAQSNGLGTPGSAISNDKVATLPELSSSASDAYDSKRVEKSRKDKSESLGYTPAVSVQEACAGTEVEFTLRGFTDQGSVLWNFGDGSFSQAEAPMHVFDDAGTYDITVSIRDHGDGTIRTRTVENMIVIRPKPEAKMDWTIEVIQPEMAFVNLSDLTENASSSMWLLRENEIKDSSVDLPIPGDYNVNLVASNKFGCQDVKSEVVKLGDRQSANAPAVFSPDNDGRYDFFLPLIAHELDGEWIMTVFDEDNQPAFITNRASQPWGGVFEDGTLARNKVAYRWELLAESLSGKKVLFSDQIKVEK